MTAPKSVGLGLRRDDGETWLAAALRIAKPWHLEWEVQAHYEQLRSKGVPEDESALGAVLEWDVAEIIPEED